MSESFLISLREGFEAALVISIVLAYAKRTGDRQAAKWIWTGTAAAIGVAMVAGIVLHLTIDGLEGTARLRTFAAICILAAALLTWMIFWMASHGRSLKGDLENRTATALASGSGAALAGVAFAAVAREGLETALFLLSTTASNDGAQVAAGSLFGLAVAVVLGVLIYRGSERVEIRMFFRITGALIILFAAGLAGKSILLLQAAGDLGSLERSVYDVSNIAVLTARTQVGRFLSGIFGWNARPSLEQVVVYLAYLLPVGWAYFRKTRTGGAKPLILPESAEVAREEVTPLTVR